MLVDLKIKDGLINTLTQDKMDLQEENGGNISEINEWKLSHIHKDDKINSCISEINQLKDDNKEKNTTILELKKKLESRENQIKEQEKEKQDLIVTELESKEYRENLISDTDRVINFQKNQLQVNIKTIETLEEAKLNSDRHMESLRIEKEHEVLKVREEVMKADLKRREVEDKLDKNWTTISTMEDELDEKRQDYKRLQKSTRQTAGENSLNKSAINFLGNSAWLSTESSRSLLDSNKQCQKQIEKMTDSLKEIAQTNKANCEIVQAQIENSELANDVSKSLSFASTNSEKAITLAEKFERGAELSKNQLKRLNKGRKKKGMERVKNPDIQGVKRKADFDLEETNKSKRDTKKRNI